jgi:adenylate kinase
MGEGVSTPGLLLLGPTGVGKTPLGEYAESQGFQNHRCSHFDFGANLRKVDQTGKPQGKLTHDDVMFIHKVLTEGALLEHDTFYIAEELLRAHIQNNSLGPDDYVLLNGLPRHADQARDIESIVSVERVVHLHCTPEVVYERIRTNSGGDRTERSDDAPEAIARKLEIFETRTQPLVEYYRSRGISVIDIGITATSSPETIWAQFERS